MVPIGIEAESEVRWFSRPCWALVLNLLVEWTKYERLMTIPPIVVYLGNVDSLWRVRGVDIIEVSCDVHIFQVGGCLR